MKRLLTLFILLFSLTEMSAQKPLADRRPIWFGVNMGGTWQTSDMKPVGGIGWGITVGRNSRMSKPGPLYFGWRFRFLDGRNFGYNYHGLTGIQANPVLSSGTTNYSTGATTDTAHVFSNYKMRFDEFAFELVVGSNSLRKKGILLYGFGAAGLNYWKTTTDQLDISGNKYDYSTISLSGDNSIVQPQLESMWDGEYETNANGSATGQWSFMPSAGFGFGYQWSNFAIVAEHRTTWALNDLIDGTNHNGAAVATGNNDIYHYDGLTLRWNFATESHSTTNNPPPPPPNPNNYNNVPPPNNNNTNTNTNTNTNNNSNSNQNVPQLQPPTVQFTTPNVDPYITSVLNQSLVVRLTNITAASQISLVINGQANSNFSFNPSTLIMNFTHTLLPGNNTYKVIATNSVGSAQDVQTITYKGNEPPVLPPPVVTITNPAACPFATKTPAHTLTATISNVTQKSQVTVVFNNQTISTFTYVQQGANGVISFPVTLNAGANNLAITGTNTVGTDVKNCVLTLKPATAVLVPPVVTITAPSACPFTTKVAAQTITATITNVAQSSQITVLFNNQTVSNFTYVQKGANGLISFPVTLNTGANNLSITGNNADGTDNTTCVLTYKPSTPEPAQPPVVTITAPAACPVTVAAAAYTVTATITNVTQADQVTVLFNNQAITNFTYTQNGANASISFPVTLNVGTNDISITGTNKVGVSNKTCSVIYRVVTPAPVPPTVNITTPFADPFNTTTAPITFLATVLNVNSAAEITVKVNNVAVSGWVYDMQTKVVTYSMTLTPGNTVFKVGAQNANGTDVDQTTVILKENVPTVQPPVVNITQPSANPYTTTVAQQTIIATVLNVTQQSQITVVRIPSTPVPFTFDAVTNKVTFSVVLPQGTSTYKIVATNSAGTANDATALTLSATAPTDPGKGGSSSNSGKPGNNPTAAPTVSVVTPATNNSHTGDQQFAVAMIVQNVTGTQQIVVKVNNVTMTSGVNYNATNGSLTFTANLNNGTNVIQVTATNSLGTASKTFNINYVPSGNKSSGGSGDPKVEPKKDEPKKEEPKKIEPKKTESVKVEPSKTEPVKTEPKKATVPAPAPSVNQPRPR